MISTPDRCLRRRGATLATARPSAAICRRSSISGCRSRAASSAVATTSTSFSRRPVAHRPRVAAKCPTTEDASSRGLRSGVPAGAATVMASATKPPTTASIQRPKACPSPLTRVATMTPCVPACSINNWPAPARTASDIATMHTAAICHTPTPKKCTNTSPTSTPIATPTVNSATRRRRLPYVKPRQIIAVTGAKNGTG